MSSKDEDARKLAEWHYSIEAGIQQIFRLVSNGDEEADSKEPIKLLEVNEQTVPSGIVPLTFGPIGPITHASTIVEVTPQEFDQIRSCKLALPLGWKLGELLPRAASADVE